MADQQFNQNGNMPPQQGAQPHQQPPAQQPYQQPPAQQPYQQGVQPYQQQPYQQQPYGGAYPAQPMIEDKSTTYIVLSVLEILLCGGIFGIIPLVLSIQYKNAVSAGLVDQAAAKRKSARTALIVVLIVGIIAVIATIILTVVSASYYSRYY